MISAFLKITPSPVLVQAHVYVHTGQCDILGNFRNSSRANHSEKNAPKLTNKKIRAYCTYIIYMRIRVSNFIM